MIKTERKEVTRVMVEDIPVKGSCDGCGKEFIPVSYNSGRPEEKKYDYYRVVTHHHNWGNDSVDSYEASEFCCVGCLMQFVSAYWIDKRKCATWNMTHEMNIKHMLELSSYD